MVPTKAIILAAGFGSRLLPATKSISKPMLAIVDRPAIDYVVADYIDAGIKEIIIVGKQYFDQIESYFDRQLALEKMLEAENKPDLLASITKYRDIQFTYVRQAQPGGPGDAVMAAYHLIKDDEAVFVSYTDDLIFPKNHQVEMLAAYKQHPGTIVMSKNVPANEAHRYGIMQIADTIDTNLFLINGLVEKPKNSTAPTNLAILSPMIIDKTVINILAARPQSNQKDHSNLSVAIGEAAKVSKVYAYASDRPWIDIGNKAGFVKAQIAFGLHDPTISEEIKTYLRETVTGLAN